MAPRASRLSAWALAGRTVLRFHEIHAGQVVALCDLVEERMQAFAADLPGEVTFYTDYKAMCEADDIDAVFVGTPNQWHVPIALEAVRNGKHVMVTKPLADSEAAARQLVTEAEAGGGCQHDVALHALWGQLPVPRQPCAR